MALIKCEDCGKEFSDKAKACPNCGCPLSVKKEKIKKEKEIKGNRNVSKKTQMISIIIVIVVLVGVGIYFLLGNDKMSNEEKNKIVCDKYVKSLKVYIDKKDTSGFDSNWGKNDEFSDIDGCTTYKCVCPESWDMFILNKKYKAEDLLSKGLVSSAYDAMGSNYISEYSELKNYFNNNDLFKLISSKEKEQATGVSYSFGEWKWKHEVGGSFNFNKRYVSYGSSSMTLKFDNYSDKVLISGHLAPNNHPNWNSEKNISVNWYNYKVIDNKIFIKLERENESQYDSIFEIVNITDRTLSLKLIMNLDDVGSGQVYNFSYERS